MWADNIEINIKDIGYGIFTATGQGSKHDNEPYGYVKKG
jgi:hypothetical protein